MMFRKRERERERDKKEREKKKREKEDLFENEEKCNKNWHCGTTVWSFKEKKFKKKKKKSAFE